jgi:hypothetical protein
MISTGYLNLSGSDITFTASNGEKVLCEISIQRSTDIVSNSRQ